MKPDRKPLNPNFSSGPCSKFKGYDLNMLKDTPFGRSHRSPLGKGKLEEAIEKSKKLLKLPENYRIGIVPASDTGAFEMAMWSMLGPKGIDVVCFEAFGKGWAGDITKELKLEDVRILDAEFGKLPDLSKVDSDRDIVFTWNGTTSGVKVPHSDWIKDDRKGLTFCDATSAVFAMEIPWEKIDVCTYSWQKVLGGEGAHGMLILSPRAVERIESYDPAWPLPKIFRMKKGNKLNEGIFKGSTINTPSMLCNEDYLQALNWAENLGGLDGLIKKSKANLNSVEKFVEKHDWIEFLAETEDTRSNSSICLKFKLEDKKVDELVKLLKSENVAYDIASYRDAPKGIRIWGGATVEVEDIEIMLEWLEWGYEQVK